jgi:hypothetical protein
LEHLPTTAESVTSVDCGTFEDSSLLASFCCHGGEAERVQFRKWARLQSYNDLAELLLKHKFGGDDAGAYALW